MKTFNHDNTAGSGDEHKSAQNPPIRVSRECLQEGRLAMALFDAHVWKHYYEAIGKIFSASASDGILEHTIQHYEMLGWEVTEIPTGSSTEIKFVLPIELEHTLIVGPREQQEVPSLEP